MNIYYVTFTNGYRTGRDRIFATSDRDAAVQCASNHRQRGGAYRNYVAVFVRKAGPGEWL